MRNTCAQIHFNLPYFSVTFIEGTVSKLVKEDGVVCGVQYRDKESNTVRVSALQRNQKLCAVTGMQVSPEPMVV